MKRCSVNLILSLLARTKSAFSVGFTIAMLAGMAQADGPSPLTNIFRPLSTPAEYVHELSLLVLAICAVIFLVLTGLLVYTVIRFRRRPNMMGENHGRFMEAIRLNWLGLCFR